MKGNIVIQDEETTKVIIEKINTELNCLNFDDDSQIIIEDELKVIIKKYYESKLLDLRLNDAS